MGFTNDEKRQILDSEAYKFLSRRKMGAVLYKIEEMARMGQKKKITIRGGGKARYFQYGYSSLE